MPEQHDPKHASPERPPRHHPVRDATERAHRSLDEAAQPEPDHASHERNAAEAIAVLAVVVVLLLLAIVSGATGALRP